MKPFKRGLLDGIPIALGYLSVSFTFGILAVSFGLNWWQTVLISMTNLTSAGQFAGVSIMAATGSYFEMALAQFIINLRYSLMSIVLSQKVSERFDGLSRWILGAGITDEIFFVASNKEGTVGRSYLFGLIVIPYFGWAIGTLLGAICGNILPEILTNALGIALYGMFIAIVVPVVKKNSKTLIIVLLAVLFSCCFKYIEALKSVSVGFVVILCAVAASTIGAFFYPVGTESTAKENGE